MPNHVHLILILMPAHAEGPGLAVAETHRCHTNFINARGRWMGHLFQSRFASVVLDDDHYASAVRYASLNPVGARPVTSAERGPGRGFALPCPGPTISESTCVPSSTAFHTIKLFFRAQPRTTSSNSIARRPQITHSEQPISSPNWKHYWVARLLDAHPVRNHALR